MFITSSVKERPGNPFAAKRVSSYRSKRSVAVQLDLRIPAGAQPFVLGGAKLEAKGQRELMTLGAWPAGPLAADRFRTARVVIEAKADKAMGAFTLKLWEEGGTRLIVIDNVTFP